MSEKETELREYIDDIVLRKTYELQRGALIATVIYTSIVLFFLWLVTSSLHWLVVLPIAFFSVASLLAHAGSFYHGTARGQYAIRREIMARELSPSEIRLLEEGAQKRKNEDADDSPIHAIHALIRRILKKRRQRQNNLLLH